MTKRQFAKLFKCNWSIRSLSEISERLLALCTQDLSNPARIKRHALLMHSYCHFAGDIYTQKKKRKQINNFLFATTYIIILYSWMWFAYCLHSSVIVMVENNSPRTYHDWTVIYFAARLHLTGYAHLTIFNN